MFIISWKYIGFAVILMIAGMQSIPEDLYEAATDGANETPAPDLAKSVSMYILQRFYLLPYDTSRDFYSQYEARIAAAKEWSENL